MGFPVDFCSRLRVAWYNDTALNTLTSICSTMSARLTSLTSGYNLAMPALATTMSRWLMPWSVASLTVSEADCSTLASYLTTMTRLPSPVDSSASAWAVECSGSRTAAITIYRGSSVSCCVPDCKWKREKRRIHMVRFSDETLDQP